MPDIEMTYGGEAKSLIPRRLNHLKTWRLDVPGCRAGQAGLSRAVFDLGLRRSQAELLLPNFIMEDHYTQVEEFTVGNCVGKVWTFLQYDDKGKFVGRDFDIEIMMGDSKWYVLEHEIPHLLSAYQKCREFVERAKKDLRSTSLTPAAS
jgi:hypothetical protein